MLRALEAQKLDQMERYLWRAMRKASAADVARLANSLRALSESRRRLLGLDAAPSELNFSPKLYVVRDVSPDCPAWDRPWQEADA